jgi:hypothetical protein
MAVAMEVECAIERVSNTFVLLREHFPSQRASFPMRNEVTFIGKSLIAYKPRAFLGGLGQIEKDQFTAAVY